jgi:hypothetical protein
MAVVELRHNWSSTGYPRCKRCGAVKRSAAESSCVVDASHPDALKWAASLAAAANAGPAAPHDPVNHPLHYCSHPSGVEVIVITEHLSFCAGNAVKYILRCGLKEDEDPIEALKKARWYIDREIGRLSKGKP